MLDGTDGSGKATQIKLLAARLRKSGRQVVIEDFPQYGRKSAGLAEEYLNGKYGTANQLGPFIPSVFYAVDRFAARDRIRKNLALGKIVLANRYVTANMGHQGAKLKNRRERQDFFHWAEKLEYGFFKIPKPNQTILLYVPAKIAQKLVGNKKPRAYVRGKKLDLHEADLDHLARAADTYRQMHEYFRYPLIDCAPGGSLLSRKEALELIWREVQKVLRP